jgi:hypothetical protein
LSILNKLSSQQSKKDNESKIKLTKELSSTQNVNGIKEIVENLNNKDKRIQSDCIKVLYEIGYINPKLIENYVNEFLQIITNKKQ